MIAISFSTHTIALIVVCVTVSTSARADSPQDPAFDLRQCTDDSGTHHVNAALREFAGGNIHLQRKDGRDINVPIARLSDADKAFLRRLALASESAANSWPSLFSGSGEGLHAEYFRDTSLDEIGLVRTDELVDFSLTHNKPPYDGGKPVKEISNGWPQHFAIRWTGLLVPRHSERYTLTLEMDDGAALWLGDKLLIHNWRGDENKRYAEIDLEAGRPYPLRILYYNAWFGGGIKFFWSSKSQAKELVPRACLFLPAAAPPDKPAPATSTNLADRVSVREIDLAEPIKCDPQLNKPTLFLHPLAGGGFKLGWTDAKNRVRLTNLSDKFEPEGTGQSIKNVDLRGLTVDRDGRSTLLMAEMPDRMWLMQLDAAGKLLWRKCLVGEKGRAADQHFLDEHFSFTGRLAGTENQIVAHFAHSWNTGKSGTHQGGYFALVERDGKIVQEDKWSVSHSLDQRATFHGGSWFTLAAGDCYPKGLYLHNRTVGFGRVIYPEPEEREAFGNCGGRVNAQLGSLVPLGGDLATAMIAKRDDVSKLFFLRLAPDCTVVHQQQIADLPQGEGIQVVKLAAFGDGLLIAWRVGESETKLALVSPQGQLLGAPQRVPQPLPVHDDLIVLPNGNVAWLTTKNSESTIRLITIHVRPKD